MWENKHDLEKCRSLLPNEPFSDKSLSFSRSQTSLLKISDFTCFCKFLRHSLLRGTYLPHLVEWLFPFFYFCAKKRNRKSCHCPAFGQILENCWCLNHLWSRKLWSFRVLLVQTKIAHCFIVCIVIAGELSKNAFHFSSQKFKWKAVIFCYCRGFTFKWIL